MARLSRFASGWPLCVQVLVVYSCHCFAMDGVARLLRPTQTADALHSGFRLGSGFGLECTRPLCQAKAAKAHPQGSDRQVTFPGAKAARRSFNGGGGSGKAGRSGEARAAEARRARGELGQASHHPPCHLLPLLPPLYSTRESGETAGSIEGRGSKATRGGRHDLVACLLPVLYLIVRSCVSS